MPDRPMGSPRPDPAILGSTLSFGYPEPVTLKAETAANRQLSNVVCRHHARVSMSL
jgi:hypothetical protein